MNTLASERMSKDRTELKRLVGLCFGKGSVSEKASRWGNYKKRKKMKSSRVNQQPAPGSGPTHLTAVTGTEKGRSLHVVRPGPVCLLLSDCQVFCYFTCLYSRNSLFLVMCGVSVS